MKRVNKEKLPDNFDKLFYLSPVGVPSVNLDLTSDKINFINLDVVGVSIYSHEGQNILYQFDSDIWEREEAERFMLRDNYETE